MRALLTSFALLLLLVPVSVSRAPAARADDAPEDQSAASKAYRDAWWAETGGGNLTQALDLYAQAIQAEGPAGVKARALYRRAVVLQRIGKTEDAIRALERLAKDFPGETQPNTDARARLAEWTAVDLRSSFGDWFKRYQYSPEFQAKVIDLVLKLGSNDATLALAAQSELLTIGAASIPALREHVNSKNDQLWSRSLRLLLLLGEVPDRVVVLAYEWMNEAQAWATIVALPEARRTALAERVVGGTYFHDALRAALGGPDAAAAWLATPRPDEDGGVRRALLRGLASVLPKDSPLIERLADLPLADKQSEALRQAYAGWVVGSGHLTVERLKAWAAHSSAVLRQAAWSAIESGVPLAPAQAWPVVLAGIDAAPQKSWLNEGGLDGAFRRTLEEAPWPQDLDRAAAAVIKAGGSLNRDNPSERLIAVLERVVEAATDEDVGVRALNAWLNATKAAPGALATLIRWTRSAPRRAQRDLAFGWLLGRPPAEGLPPALDRLVDPSVPVEEAVGNWGAFFNSGSAAKTAQILTDPAAVKRLLERLRSVGEDARQSRRSLAVTVVSALAGQHVSPEALLGALYGAPEKPIWELMDGGRLRKLLMESDSVGRWREEWRRRWAGWSLRQRTLALHLSLSLLSPAEDPATVAFLRERLRARPVEIEPEVRSTLLGVFAEITLDDLRAAYDLSQGPDADEAAEFFRLSPSQPVRLAATPEVFTALKAALRPDGPDGTAHTIKSAFVGVPEVQRDLIAALLEHQAGYLHTDAVALLVTRSSPEDVELWLKALKDARVDTRVDAAKGMERVPTEKVKRALVGALDDPHPDVRAAALAALDALQKMEELKARWRERIK